MGTLRAALQLLIPKAIGVGVVPLLEQALAFPEGLLGLSPFGGFGELPFARVICFRGVLNCGCGLLIDALEISVEVRVFGGSSVLSASADFRSFQ